MNADGKDFEPLESLEQKEKGTDFTLISQVAAAQK
jgi:hypothetical protein